MRARTTWRHRVLFLSCRLAVGSMLFVAASGLPRHAVTSATPTPTAAPTATPSPNPNPIVLRNREQSCAPSAPPPAANVVSNARYPGWGGPMPNEVALTFDDGPSPVWTPPILLFLELTHTPATFFLIGDEVRQSPSLVLREWQDGFAIGDHTWSHPDMTGLSVAGMRYQFSASLQELHAVIGAWACLWFWRPPYGLYDDTVLRVSWSFGLTMVTWDVDPTDWSLPGTSVIVARVLAQVHPGAIILMHDGGGNRAETLAALPAILAGLRARGLTPVTLPKLLADGHYPGCATTVMAQQRQHDQPSI